MNKTKTNYTHQLINDYCVIDTETTGRYTDYDSIIEIALLRVRNNQIVDQFTQLIFPETKVYCLNNSDYVDDHCLIEPFITKLTGITSEMVRNAPRISEVEDLVFSFIGKDVLLGHNTSFDIRFLNKFSKKILENKYMDTKPFSQKVYPKFPKHGLSFLTEQLGLAKSKHRALADCIATKELYDNLKKFMLDNNLVISDLWSTNSNKNHSGKIIDNKVKSVDIDEDNIFYQKHVAFTGTLNSITREEAKQLVENVGGILDNSVIKKTEFLILGSTESNSILRGEKSAKLKKAEKMKSEGYEIEIMDEDTFLSEI